MVFSLRWSWLESQKVYFHSILTFWLTSFSLRRASLSSRVRLPVVARHSASRIFLEKSGVIGSRGELTPNMTILYIIVTLYMPIICQPSQGRDWGTRCKDKQFPANSKLFSRKLQKKFSTRLLCRVKRPKAERWLSTKKNQKSSANWCKLLIVSRIMAEHF